MASEAAIRFFQSPYFAVAGASSDHSKFGYKILAWYYKHSIPAQPLNPTKSSINLGLQNQKTLDLPTLPTPLQLPHPTETSLSIITPPAVTRQVLSQAKEVGVKAVWLQPGSFDQEGLEYAKKEFEVGIGGEGGDGGEGWCVLVDGPDALRTAKGEKANRETL